MFDSRSGAGHAMMFVAQQHWWTGSELTRMEMMFMMHVLFNSSVLHQTSSSPSLVETSFACKSGGT